MYLFLTAADSTGAAGGGASMILMFVVLIAVFYFFMIRPENKRKKEAQQMRDSLKVGDNITPIGGINGDMDASDVCDALKAQFTSMTFDGLTGDGMTWDASGAVSKAPKAVVIKDGAYAAM